VIIERGKKEVVPESQRAEARNRLREMGFEASVSDHERKVNVTRIPGGAAPDKKHTSTDAVEVMRCVSAVRGYRDLPKILAKSKSASADFI
jgi:hypothetical protein